MMAGKRISREIVTIEKMIKIYEKAHPAPEDAPEYYQTLFSYAIKRLKNVAMVKKNQPVNSVLYTATNLSNVSK